MRRVRRIGAWCAVTIVGVVGCAGPAGEADGQRASPRSSASAPAEQPPRSGSGSSHDSNSTDDPVGTSTQQEIGVVVYVVDGDTFDVELADGTVERVRPPQIDTPERGDCGFDESTWAVEDLLLGESVVLTPTAYGPDRDPYDRLLRAVAIDRDDVGEILVASGLARWSSHFADEDPALADRYAAAEDAARAEGLGFWSTCGW